MMVSAYFEEGGRQQIPVYRIERLQPGHLVAGAAILVDKISTIVVEPSCTAHITNRGDVRIEIERTSSGKDVGTH